MQKQERRAHASEPPLLGDLRIQGTTLVLPAGHAPHLYNSSPRVGCRAASGTNNRRHIAIEPLTFQILHIKATHCGSGRQWLGSMARRIILQMVRRPEKSGNCVNRTHEAAKRKPDTNDKTFSTGNIPRPNVCTAGLQTGQLQSSLTQRQRRAGGGRRGRGSRRVSCQGGSRFGKRDEGRILRVVSGWTALRD